MWMETFSRIQSKNLNIVCSSGKFHVRRESFVDSIYVTKLEISSGNKQINANSYM